jgi:hypothetical protein
MDIGMGKKTLKTSTEMVETTVTRVPDSVFDASSSAFLQPFTFAARFGKFRF